MKFLHKGECNYAEKVIFVHFISMQFNFPVLSMSSCVTSECWCYGAQHAGLAIFTFLGNRTFSEKMIPQNISTAGYFTATFCAYRQNKRKMDNFGPHWIKLLIFTEILIKICRFVVAMVTKHNLL